MKFTKCILALALVTIISLFSCKKDKKNEQPTPVQPTVPATPNLPTVITAAIKDIKDTTATCGGTVTSQGTAAMLAVGICWDTLPEPTTLRAHTNEGAGTGSYVSKITGLKRDKRYYVRAYATNNNGTNYGTEISFTTPKEIVWKEVPSLANKTIYCMFQDGNSIYFGTSSGLYFSPDTGKTLLAKGLAGTQIETIIRKGTAMFCTGISNGMNILYKSVDGGNNWTSLSSTFPYSVRVFGIGAIGNKLVAGTDSSAFVSTDDGNSWQKAMNGLPNPATFMGYAGRVGNVISNNNTLYASSSVWNFSTQSFLGAIFEFNASDNSWNQTLTAYQFGYMGTIAVTQNNAFICDQNSNLVSKSGGMWEGIAGLPSGNSFFAARNSIVIARVVDKLYASKDEGTSWEVITGKGIPDLNFQFFVASGYFWTGSGSQGNSTIYRYAYN